MSTLSISGKLKQLTAKLTPNERKISKALLTNYPMAGLDTLMHFAQQVHVSAPTVLRLVNKLGYTSYMDFQMQLRSELEARLQTPIMRRSTTKIEMDSNVGALSEYARTLPELLDETAAATTPHEFTQVTQLLAIKARHIWIVGGRITGTLGQYLAHHLHNLRAYVHCLNDDPRAWAEDILDMNKNDVVLIFDVRRYDETTYKLAQVLQSKNIPLVLVTDMWLSPIYRFAKHTLSTHTSAPIGWDSHAPMLMLIDALIAQVHQKLWQSSQKRLNELETLRQKL